MEPLTKEVSKEEIRRALVKMGSYKALGPDGFQPIFFKETWNINGMTVCAFVKGIMDGQPVPEEYAEALLVLISKEGQPESMKGFRPLSLCNTA